MPPPNTPEDPEAQARMGMPPQAASSRDRPYVALALPVTFNALIALSRLTEPLLFFTLLSTSSVVRSRFFLTWQGRSLSWTKVSGGLLWASVAGWLSGQALYVLTVVYMWRAGGERRRRRELHGEVGG